MFGSGNAGVQTSQKKRASYGLINRSLGLLDDSRKGYMVQEPELYWIDYYRGKASKSGPVQGRYIAVSLSGEINLRSEIFFTTLQMTRNCENCTHPETQNWQL